MNFIKKHWFICLLVFLLLVLIIVELSIKHSRMQKAGKAQQDKTSLVPDIHALPVSAESDLIRYGKDLISNTSKYFGSHGIVGSISNGLDCENCHLEAGTRLYTNNFLAVASTYPKFRPRSGKLESVEFRINECLQRSLNGDEIDSTSREMRAMVAYINWTGTNVARNEKGNAIKSNEIPYLDRPADSVKGKVVYLAKCKSCHGENGEGILSTDSGIFVYPPLWGKHSYAVSAGMYRITKLASFVKFNMPLGASFENPQLTDGDAWDVAAYINSQPHPTRMFEHDWPVLATKPADYPFGPFADTFSYKQHKYGPFIGMKAANKK